MIIPVIKTGAASPSNGWFDVQMPDDLHNDQSWLGVLGQEVFECRWKWRHLLQRHTIAFRQDMEITSHAVEAYIATVFDGRPHSAYQEYMVLMLDHPNGYRAMGYFAGMSRDDIARQLRERLALAAAWVERHREFFAEWKKRRAA